MTGDIRDWLRSLGLEQYGDTFVENDVDLDIVENLDDADLKELGLSLGHRRKFLRAISSATETPPTSAAPSDAPSQTGPERNAVPHTGGREAERRQVTVMFCDLVGSTALSASLDPEDMSDVLTRFQDCCAGIVTRYEGYIARYMGDGILIYFGYPNAHEDDAERAIGAGLEITDAVARLPTPGEVPLSARTGIATGRVVVGDIIGEGASQESAIVGDTPNLAARLQSQAEPGEVVIAEATHRLAGAMFSCAPMDTATLKGFRDPVRAFRVHGRQRQESRFDALHGERLTRFTGRAQELDLMMSRWQDAREGDGQVVLLSGEAGIGKSRILRELRNAQKDEGQKADTLDTADMHLQCAPNEVNAAFHPIIAELEAAADLYEESDPARKLDRLAEALGPSFENPDEAIGLLALLLSLPEDRFPLPPASPQRRKQQTIEVLCERIASLAALRPLTLIVEDVHWADASTRDFLDALVEKLADLPVLAVITFRPEFRHLWGDFGHVTAYSLNRLSRRDARRIAENVTGGKSLPDELLDLIVQRTDGIPLFVEEFTKSLLETGILKEEGSHLELTGPLPSLAIPDTLQDSLMARLDRLAPVKRVVQTAACIGRVFPAHLLGAALPMDEAELDAALDQLLEAGLVFRHGAAEDKRFIFKHALVQDAAYESILRRTRREMHRHIATALEEFGDADPLDLARHYGEAGLPEKAAALYLKAGRRSLAAFALPEATGTLEAALAQAEAMEETEGRYRVTLDIRVALGAARMAQYGWAHDSVAAALEPAFPLARSAGDAEALGSILWGMWVHYQTRTDFPNAHNWLAELKSVSEEREESDLPVIYDMSAGCQYFWEADYPRALGHTDRLRGHYDQARHARIAGTTNHDPLVFSQHWAGSLADWIRGRPGESIERMEEAIDLARRVGHPFNTVFALTAGATALIYLDRPEDLLANCAEAETLSRKEALGPFSETVNISQWRGAAHIQRGDFQTGYELAKTGNDFWNASGGRICNAMFRSWIVRALAGLGRLEEAMSLNADCIAHCRETGDRYMEPEVLRLHGMLMEASGADCGAVEARFREALALADAHGANSWYLRAALSLAGLLQVREERDAARDILAPALDRFEPDEKSHDPQTARNFLEIL